jgi:hypothetical protein
MITHAKPAALAAQIVDGCHARIIGECHRKWRKNSHDCRTKNRDS